MRLGDYPIALNTGKASTPEKERYVRTRYWWAMNDLVRQGKAEAPSNPDFKGNLLKLRVLLSHSNPNQRLMAAEASRELGDFKTAGFMLDFKYPNYYAGAVEIIKRLTKAKDLTVRQLVQ